MKTPCSRQVLCHVMTGLCQSCAHPFMSPMFFLKTLYKWNIFLIMWLSHSQYCSSQNCDTSHSVALGLSKVVGNIKHFECITLVWLNVSQINATVSLLLPPLSTAVSLAFGDHQFGSLEETCMGQMWIRTPSLFKHYSITFDLFFPPAGLFPVCNNNTQPPNTQI